MRLVALVALALLAGLPPVAAQDAKPPADKADTAEPAKIESVLRDAGLFGAWAVDCAGPPTPANPHVSIVMADGGSVIERHELGGDYEINDYRVTAARRLSKTRVLLEVLFEPESQREQAQRLVVAVDKDTRRTIFNQVVGGKVLVKDGVVSGHHVKTPELKKCG